LCTNSCEDRLS